MNRTQIIVIGAGPAGLMAATAAAENGAQVLVIERNEKAGRKLAITGKGRCNVTNAADIRIWPENTVNNPRFALSALNRLTNQDLMQRIEAQGVPLKIERGERVFPQSDKAFDIVDACVKMARRAGAKFAFGERVIAVEPVDGGFAVTTDKTVRETDKVILATGGLSYPTTGSTGDGYRVASSMGHTVIPQTGGLVPLTCEEVWPRRLQGLSLKNVAIRITRQKKTLYTDFGEMLFTHFGVSGPMILSASGKVQAALRKEENPFAEPVILHIDMKPALTEEQLILRIQRDFEKYGKKSLLHAMEDLLPKRMIPEVLKIAGLAEEKKAETISVKEVRRLAGTLKNLTCRITGTRPIAEAIITQGGVDTREINPKTMESKKVPGLYFAGELIDVDALTGGFNLQIAFSTGYVAGTAAATSSVS